MKRYLLTILFCLFPFGADAMIQSFSNGTFNNLPTGTTKEYNMVTSPGTAASLGWASGIASRQSPVPEDGTFRNINIILSGTPGTGNSYDFTLMVNGSRSLLDCDVTASVASCDSGATEVSVSELDLVSLEVEAIGIPTGRDMIGFSIEFEADAGSTYIMTGRMSNNVAGGAEQFAIPSTGSAISTDLNDHEILIPHNTTLTKFCVDIAIPGNSTFDLSVYKNGVEEASSILNITSSDPDVCTSALTIDLAPTDTIAVSVTESAGSSGSMTNISYGLSLSPDTDGESIVAGLSTDLLPSSGTEYNVLGSGETTWNGTASNRTAGVGMTEFTYSNLYVETLSAESSGIAYDFTILDDLVSTGITCQMTSTNCSDTSNEYTWDDPTDLIYFRAVHSPFATPVPIRWSWVQFIDPNVFSKAEVIVSDVLKVVDVLVTK